MPQSQYSCDRSIVKGYGKQRQRSNAESEGINDYAMSILL